jgi:hypothetical protein
VCVCVRERESVCVFVSLFVCVFVGYTDETFSTMAETWMLEGQKAAGTTRAERTLPSWPRKEVKG